MAYNSILIKRRLPGGLAGAPSWLSGGELAFNEVDSTLYYGSQAGVLSIAGPGAFVSRTLAQNVSGSKTWEDTQYFLQDIDVVGTVDANAYTINGTSIIDSSRNGSFADISASGNLTVTGNLSVLGDVTSIETTTTVASAFSITNSGSEAALTVTQTGEQPVAVFYDDANVALYIDGKTGTEGYVGIGTATPNEKLTVVGNVSATGDIFAVNADFTGTLNVDGTTTLNNDLTVVDKIQVQSSDFSLSRQGTHIELAGSHVRVSDDQQTADTTYGLNGIYGACLSSPYEIHSNMTNVKLNTRNGTATMELGTGVGSEATFNVTAVNGTGATLLQDFVVDGGIF